MQESKQMIQSASQPGMTRDVNENRKKNEEVEPKMSSKDSVKYLMPADKKLKKKKKKKNYSLASLLWSST